MPLVLILACQRMPAPLPAVAEAESGPVQPSRLSGSGGRELGGQVTIIEGEGGPQLALTERLEAQSAVHLLPPPANAELALGIPSAQGTARLRSGADTMGARLNPAGDLDGDGVEDLIVGVPRGGIDEVGAVYLLAGPIQGQLDLADAGLRLDGAWTGELPDQLGGSAPRPGDLDGDGLDDLVLSAFYATDEWEPKGAVYFFSGPLTEGGLASEQADATIQGRDTRSVTGKSMCVLGDATGDGIPDLAIGADDDGSSGRPTGTVYVMAGPLLDGTTDDAVAIVHGHSAGGMAGWSVTPVGDLDGDGLADLALGAPHQDLYGGADSAGLAAVVLAPSGESTVEAAALRIEGQSEGETLGFELRSREVEGEVQLLVGAPGASAVGIYRLPQTGVLTLEGADSLITAADGSRFGASFALSDDGGLLVGAPGAQAGAGEAWWIPAELGGEDLELDLP